MNMKEKKRKKIIKSLYVAVKTKVKAGVYVGLTLTGGIGGGSK